MFADVGSWAESCRSVSTLKRLSLALRGRRWLQAHCEEASWAVPAVRIRTRVRSSEPRSPHALEHLARGNGGAHDALGPVRQRVRSRSQRRGGTRARESPGGHLSGRAVVDQLDQLYEDSAQSGRIMTLALHPFVIGQPLRRKYLARALEYVSSHEGVWLTTSDEIAERYVKTAALTMSSPTGRTARLSRRPVGPARLAMPSPFAAAGTVRYAGASLQAGCPRREWPESIRARRDPATSPIDRRRTGP